ITCEVVQLNASHQLSPTLTCSFSVSCTTVGASLSFRRVAIQSPFSERVALCDTTWKAVSFPPRVSRAAQKVELARAFEASLVAVGKLFQKGER
ncbi:hypothetical protein BgiBS90_021447, partial [Biomphalaria glabrata]